jgi:hypothetical protein
MFDKLCLLAEGRMAYMGTPRGALTFLRQMHFLCPDQFNPADFFIRTLALHPGKEAESRLQIKAICDNFAKSPKGKSLEERAEAEWKISDFQDLSVCSTDSVSYKTPLGYFFLNTKYSGIEKLILLNMFLVSRQVHP